jgi:hypothetical protein
LRFFKPASVKPNPIASIVLKEILKSEANHALTFLAFFPAQPSGYLKRASKSFREKQQSLPSLAWIPKQLF